MKKIFELFTRKYPVKMLELLITKVVNNSQLAAFLKVKPSNLNRDTQALLKLGLITREIPGGTKGGYDLFITEKGRTELYKWNNQ